MTGLPTPPDDDACYLALQDASSILATQAARLLDTPEAWQPWRSYAVIRAWASLPTAPRTPPDTLVTTK